ncbi:nucleotide sugar dehydrogenase [bacterium (Candidatus Gribaldobacteria) CG_4_10_14_0_2_um_filter_41_16]|uniref:Nucleotide sugar dehydrogenase n=3 Tax=Candidatus Gribaldobacteria TaxID=2798536 RepID=A0A2M7VHM5_9BACT|nr:MAG: UDP-N-acetyl-D-galactosamine dehydrogenase [Parcubacteria group bacterium CG1_02_41_26]PIV47225.1 MAG: nucleotide sugar dehydrogenase [bacterium (Candidatus Gribaldobacteria) CG02_land_8_20_14_3_00_41_15]PIX02954.1 MAG: nucleotide sugar dehydrogenase [bacterium (Candidatus Gribaldobacteria) CG_4_8_14_3_um_filter_42_11]PJA01327.1 MAG: nucleotide sugar dehydrogenase [bacterium (Candidatus Gribaldobacteria) CG_4_10_14_0_2_um_filter_41_16]
MNQELKNSELKICVIGLGYVGLPLAIEFAKKGVAVYGFDVKENRVEELKAGHDSSDEVADADLAVAKIEYSADPAIIKKANFLIVAVPTPVDQAKKPDLSLVESASRLVGENMQKGNVVVYESTVYPGVTEDICLPIIEKYSGLKCGVDWKIGYSPERMNPGDKEHSVDKIIKVVSGMDQESADKIAQVYGLVCATGVFKAANIKTAEAAKVIENIQRDLNIALMNELALIFHRLNINTQEVLEAASTKWNFHKYQPGFPGGHCISVDPYYLTYRAEELGYHPEIILAGRRINDYMAEYTAELLIKGLARAGKKIKDAKVLILGLTFKENVRDTRNSKVKDIIKKLQEYGCEVYGYDSLVEKDEAEGKFKVKYLANLSEAQNMDGVILATLHHEFKAITLEQLKTMMPENPVLVDVKSHYLKQKPQDKGFIYQAL